MPNNTHNKDDGWDAEIAADAEAGRLDFLLSKIKNRSEFETLLVQYSKGELSFGKLAERTGLSHRELFEIFATRKIERPSFIDAVPIPSTAKLLDEWRYLRSALERSEMWPAVQWLAVATNDEQRAERRALLDSVRKRLPEFAFMLDKLQAIELTFNLWRSAYTESLNQKTTE